MNRGTLKTVRFLAPPIIILTLYSMAAKTLGFSEIGLPKSAKDLWFNAPALVMALAYYLSPLRSWANGGHHKNVQLNIRTQMLRTGQVKDASEIPTKKIMNVFYRQIDNDASLKARSEDIMFNGAIWTTLADLVSLSSLFSVGLLISWLADALDSLEISLGFAVLAIGCAILQYLATQKHIQMSNGQLEYIADHKREEVRADFENILSE